VRPAGVAMRLIQRKIRMRPARRTHWARSTLPAVRHPCRRHPCRRRRCCHRCPRMAPASRSAPPVDVGQAPRSISRPWVRRAVRPDPRSQSQRRRRGGRHAAALADPA
jgi:hypothetical protein